MAKRLFDLLVSLIMSVLLSPLLLVLALAVKFSSKGPAFYMQERIGKNQIPFRIFKFRTMFLDADKKGLITVGGRDPRVTRVGYFLRKYKLDELPQLFNVVLGEMSLVGPRPEVKRYVEMYSVEQKKVLEVKPGITDYASIEYANENELLGKAKDPEKMYVEEIMPAKLKLNLRYVEEKSFFVDLKIIFRTAMKIFGN
ncbi:MAG: sugar transferase [Bacteroidetes bacterium]|nr:sugar transferase [Bacteroidota bacterium]